MLRPGGQALVSVPFRHADSIAELGTDRRLYQRHYSTTTIRSSLLEPSGLVEHGRILYGERLRFYRLATRAPAALDWLRRPWDSLITLLALRPVSDATKASAVLIDLRNPGRDTISIDLPWGARPAPPSGSRAP